MSSQISAFPTAENRQHQRFDVRLAATIVLSYSEVPVTVINISMRGAKLEVPPNIAFNESKIKLRLGCGEGGIPADIRWRGMSGMGVEFRAEGSMRDRLEKCIERIINDHAPG